MDLVRQPAVISRRSRQATRASGIWGWKVFDNRIYLLRLGEGLFDGLAFAKHLPRRVPDHDAHRQLADAHRVGRHDSRATEQDDADRGSFFKPAP
jgi:hypothetical protein